MADSLNIVGVMSGTSMDGLDLVLCKFKEVDKQYSYEVLGKQEISFNDFLLEGLKSCRSMSALELSYLDIDLGKFVGRKVREFVSGLDAKADYVASHGHTVFHNPKQGLTKQIGSGAEIAIHSGLKAIVDFRTIDVALGGQGAPLVPIGDWNLFSEYDACLNLGGISNISMKSAQKAFDISPCNLVLNELVKEFDLAFDKGGELGSKGELNEELFEELNQIEFYHLDGPKSLGAEFLEESFYPVLNKYQIKTIDKLTTVYHHIAFQVSKYLQSNKVLITGGGAHNSYLLELFESYSGYKFEEANNDLINFKEAIIFAFMGFLRASNQENVNNLVTGAKQSNIGGAIYLPVE